jgi:glycosyltransferase involved in cell wall biosynthesis
MFFSREVERGLSKCLSDTRPDIAIVHHYLKKLSPAVLVALKRHGVPIISILSDFYVICLEAHLQREGRACFDCITKGPMQAVINGCVKNSRIVSLVDYAARRWHLWRRYFDLVDAFVVPTRFMRERLVEAGWSAEKLHVIPTFVKLDSTEGAITRENRIAYVGQGRRIKGFFVLLKAFDMVVRLRGKSAPTLMVAGQMQDRDCQSELDKLPRATASRVVLTGMLSPDGVRDLLRRSLFSVVPSICCENFPNAALESLACGTPVIGSRVGGIPEIVEHGRNGLLVEANDAERLAEAMVRLSSDSDLRRELGETARNGMGRWGEDLYFQKLGNVIADITGNRMNHAGRGSGGNVSG